ncbi:hypothetical protein SAMN04487939_101755 [Lysobacter sp. yr284]|uniref:hypothetical protein n=1 Tax=Lysobacter sp. yr284 TaxID=1761791 RepID=UPI0008942190|nr:hypothetical protein [Lysobacter sp. yr284]SDY30969.1 hypothetical protein SAMN04487939_101755 [Lysobacter sp. yr284]
MTDWSALEDAYGPADEVPALLAALDPDPAAQVWTELWSRICHQGTVYSASYPALPFLFEAARGWAPSARVMPVSLAATILASPQTGPGERERYAALAAQLRSLAAESLQAPGLPRADIVCLQQAVLLLDGEPWAEHYDRLLSGELDGSCPACATDLMVVIGEYGFFLTDQEWVHGKNERSAPIVPADPAALPPVGEWLWRGAQGHGDDELQAWIAHLFGSGRCPACAAQWPILAAVSA